MKRFTSLLCAFAICFGTADALAQTSPLSLNYDNLSFFEEPLAHEIGPATASVKLLIDQAVKYNIESDDDTYPTRVNGQLNIEGQLPNSWTLGAQYFGSYDDSAADEYTDNAAVYLSDEWGLISGGNVTGAVREKVRRRRGVGNANLRLDNFLGELDETGGFYTVRSNAYEFSITSDFENNIEAGATYSRPIGNSFYRVGLRGRTGETPVGSLVGAGDSIGGLAIASYAYSRSVYEAQIGYEDIDLDTGSNIERVFGSAGFQHSFNRALVSLEGHLGDLDGTTEYGAAAGLRYNLARGASLNFGYNYSDVGAAEIQEFLASIRYEF